MRNTVNEAGNDWGSLTVALPDCIKWLERYKPTPAERPHVSNLTQQLKRWPDNPVLGPMILKSVERLSAANAEEC